MFRKGFTLIELLVVIGIIGILSTVGLVSFTSASQRGRDGKRESDIAQTRAALELYRSQFGKYPLSANFSAMASTLQTSDYLSPPLPADPKPAPYTQYSYSYANSGATYCLCAKLEHTGGGNSTNASCTSGAGDYYCMIQP